MRGHAHPPTDPQAPLKPARRSLAAATVLLVVALLTGGATSPVAPLLAAALVFVVRTVPSVFALAAPFVVSIIFVIAGMIGGDVATSTIIAAIAFSAAAAPGWLWRRQVTQGDEALRELAEIRDQANRSDTSAGPSAVQALDDLQRALQAVTMRIGALHVALWDVNVSEGVIRPRMTSSGRLSRTLRLVGDPLGWVWEQRMRMQLDPAPHWAGDANIVIADVLTEGERGGTLVTYGWQGGTEQVSLPALQEAAIYLRGILGLQHARAHANEAEQRLQALVAGLQKIPGALELDVLATELCATAMDITDGTGAAVGLWNGETGTLLAVAGEDGGPVAGDMFAPPDSELAFAVRADSRIVRSADEGWRLGSTHLADRNERWARRPRALAVLPLRSANGTTGVLAVWTSAARSLDPKAVDLLHALTSYAVLHIEHARAFGRLRETAERDPLTQLRNRRAFDSAFDAERVRFDRYHRPLSLLVMDLDHFKSVNDRYGHEAGDEVLRNMARIISANLRDTDVAARFGGEEFVVLMPETTLAAALEAAERIRSSVENAVVDWQAQRIPLRVSIGVASVPETTAHPQDLVGAADAALYEAKRRGRNRVIAAGR